MVHPLEVDSTQEDLAFSFSEDFGSNFLILLSNDSLCLFSELFSEIVCFRKLKIVILDLLNDVEITEDLL